MNLKKKEVQQLFSGYPVILRKEMSLDDIRIYERAMMEAGARCTVISDNNQALPPTPLEVIMEPKQIGVTKPDNSVSPKFQIAPRMGRVRYTASLWDYYTFWLWLLVATKPINSLFNSSLSSLGSNPFNAWLHRFC